MKKQVFAVIIICSSYGIRSDDLQASKTEKNRGLVIDTDIGADDAMAISLVILKQKRSGFGDLGPLMALTTVTGNTGANNASRNARYLLEYFNLSIPVIEGGLDSLTRRIEPTFFFGFDGFGDFLKHPIAKEIIPPIIAPQYLAKTAMLNEGQITFVFIGPLTNLALALHINPLFVKQSRRIIILGGNYQGVGDVPGKPGVEANMYSDPDAANYFFERYSTPEKVTLVPAEAVKAMSYPMCFRRNKLGKVKGNLIKLLNNAEAVGNEKLNHTWSAYDQSACSILLEPSVVTRSVPARVTVVTEGPRGVMLADLEDPRPNVNLITHFNRTVFTKILLTYLSS